MPGPYGLLFPVYAFHLYPYPQTVRICCGLLGSSSVSYTHLTLPTNREV